MEHKAQGARDSSLESNRGLGQARGPQQCAHRVTNFYIDNILRADFGRRRPERSPAQEEQEEQEQEEREVTRDKERGARGSESGDEAEAEASAGPALKPLLWPAWVYCTRYSDRPSAGPRARKPKKCAAPAKDDKRPRTAFSAEQLARLKAEFQSHRYLTEQRRQGLARELGLNESQIKIWFQNKRAKIKKATGNCNALALSLRAQGLYNHSTSNRSDSE